MPLIPKEYKYRCFHDKGESACFNVALYSKKQYQQDETLKAADFIYSDGTYPKEGDNILCGFCKKFIYPGRQTGKLEPYAQE